MRPAVRSLPRHSQSDTASAGQKAPLIRTWGQNSWAVASRTASDRNRSGAPAEAGRAASITGSVLALTGLLAERRIDLLAGLDQTLHGVGRILEHLLLFGIQLDLDDLLHAVGADHHRHADIHAVLTVLAAIQPGGTGQHAALVLEVALGHLDGGRGRRVEGRAGLQQGNDLGAAIAEIGR